MSNTSVIRSFLVSLGWDVDTAGMDRFASSIAVQSEAVRELGEGMKAAALKIAGFVRDLASGMDTLYFASVKTKASAANLEALRYAAEQTGISFDAVKGNIQALANFITYKPGGATWLHQLGVEAKDADGKVRDTATVFQELAQAIAQRPAQNKLAYLQFLGIDPQVFEAVTSGKFDGFFREHQDQAKNSGVDQNAAAAKGNALLTQIRRIEDRIHLFETGVGADLLGRALPYIEKFVDGATKGVQRLIDWWDHLSGASKTIIKWSLLIGGALAAVVAALAALGVIAGVVGSALGALGTAVGALLSPLALAGLAAAATAVGVAFANNLDWQAMIDGCKGFAQTIEDLVTKLTDQLPPAIKKAGSQAKAFVDDLLATDGNRDHLQKESAGVFQYDPSNYNKVKRWLGLPAAPTPSPAPHTTTPGQGATRGLRNNNAGNIEYGTFARAQGSTGVEAQGRFATFATAQDGLNAAAALLRRYAAQGIDSVQAIISKYAPAKGKDGQIENNTAAYIAYVAKRMGVSADARLNLNDPQQLAQIERAIVQMESGPNPYSAEMYNRAAQKAIGGGSTKVAVTQHITTTVTGAADPHGVNRAVAGAIDKGNGLLVRAVQGRTS